MEAGNYARAFHIYNSIEKLLVPRSAHLTAHEQEQLAKAYAGMCSSGTWSGIDTNSIVYCEYAWHWHQKAAAQNEPDALYALSMQYSPQNAWYVKGDDHLSTDYLIRAAEHGQRDALLLLITYDFVKVPEYHDRVSNALSRAVSNGNRDVIHALKQKECQQGVAPYVAQSAPSGER